MKNVEINGHLHRSAHLSKCVCMHIYVHSWVCIVCISTHVLYVYLHTYECASSYMYRSGCSILFISEYDPMNVLVFVQVNSCMCAHGSTHTCVRFHFVVCMCICMYLHMNLHTCACAFVYASFWLCMSTGMVHSVNAYVHVV